MKPSGHPRLRSPTLLGSICTIGRTKLVLQLFFRVDLEVIAIKVSSTLPKVQGLDSHPRIQFSINIKLMGSYPSAKILQHPSPVGWGYRIQRLHFCRWVKLTQRMSWIWRKTIWWRGSDKAGALGNPEYPFIAIARRSTLFWSGSNWLGTTYGSNRTVWYLNCV